VARVGKDAVQAAEMAMFPVEFQWVYMVTDTNSNDMDMTPFIQMARSEEYIQQIVCLDTQTQGRLQPGLCVQQFSGRGEGDVRARARLPGAGDRH
jgi:hypothetical protein